MRIHFSNVNFSSRSGPNSFGTRLAHEMVKRGHQVVSHRDDYDIFLAFVEPASAPRANARVIQRLDGIWFKPDQFHTHNRRIKATYERSHHVIFQSQFDRDMVEHHWGVRPGTVIHNGIDLQSKKVPLSGNLELPHDVGRLFVCSSNWHPQKRLSENVRLYRQVREDRDMLVVLGSNPDVKLDIGLREHWIGNQPHEVCLAFFDRADWMIHLAWLDHCPNVVVEALSQGCPVICAADGGTKELVRDNGVIVSEVRPYKFELTDYDDPPPVDLLDFALPDRVTVDPSYLDIGKVADKYEKVFRQISA